MAQWLGQFTGNTHKSSVQDAEALLRHAVRVFNDADTAARHREAKTVRRLATRLLRARVHSLKARIAAAGDPPTNDAAGENGRHRARLERALAKAQSHGINGIL